MPFPPSGRVVFRRNPLAEVICQLRFPAILAIAAKEPTDFQERIRDEYPVYRLEGGPPLPPPLRGLLPPEIQAQFVPSELRVHQFLTSDERRMVGLARDYVAVTENRYERWEAFRDQIHRIRDALSAVYRPAFLTRIGLRYRDVIDRESLGLRERAWRDLLRPEFSGLLASEQIHESIQELETRGLVKLPSPVGGFVRLRHGFIQHSGNGSHAYLIDADFYTEDRSDPADILRFLEPFNRLAGDLFRWAIQKPLFDALEPETVS